MSGPAVAVAVVWHPADMPGPTSEVPVELPQQLFRLLQSDPTMPANERSGMSVRLHTGAQREDGTADLPPGIGLGAGAAVLVVVLVGHGLYSDTRWRDWVRELALRIEATPSSVLLPIAMFEGAIGLDRTLNGVAAERVFEESSLPERDRSVRIAVLRSLSRMLNDQRRLSVFVSHAKADGARIAAVLADYMDTLKGDAWIDVEQIESGNRFQKVLDEALDPRNTVFVAVVTDVYATREWCRWEAQMAKVRGIPMLALDMVTEGQRRSLPALGNVPVVRLNTPLANDPDAEITDVTRVACRRVMEAVLLEFVNARYFSQRVIALADRFGYRTKNWTYFSPSPDLIALVSRRVELKRKSARGVYPDPRLPDFERQLLEGVVGAGLLATPLSLVTGLSTASVGHEPRALKVAISISRPAFDELRRRALSTDHVDALFLNVCRFLLAAGHSVAYGGAPAEDFTTTLGDIERTYRFADPSGDLRLVNYIAHSFRPPQNTPTGYEEVMTPILVDPAPRTAESVPFDAMNDLTVMRTRMARETDMRVIAAGDLQPGRPGTRRGPGLLEEAFLTLAAGRPLLVIGGVGGAGRLVLDALLGRSDTDELDSLRAHFATPESLARSDQPVSFDHMIAAFNPATALNNELTEDENLRLATSTDIDEIATLVVLAAHRISLARDPVEE